jgi:hypothetical protein
MAFDKLGRTLVGVSIHQSAAIRRDRPTMEQPTVKKKEGGLRE